MNIISKNTMTIKSAQRDIKLIIGHDLVSHLTELNIIPESTSGFIVVTDKNVTRIHGDNLTNSLKKLNKQIVLIEIEATEEKKSFGQVEDILSVLLNKGVNRKFLMINFGGGIVSDIGGFAAGILYRGIPYINIPTTLLSQVDAAFGGKTGVNFRVRNLLFKNMVGTINMPLAVISDMRVLDTLPAKEIKNGLGEMMKYALISKTVNIADLINIKNGLHDKKLLGILVSECQQIKMEAVRKDPDDTFGIREQLNLGHTIGHGIESASNGKLSHGQCVATGIAAITKISMAQGILSAKLGREIINNIEKLGLPITIHNLNCQRIMESMKLDKKNGSFVLIKNIGEVLTNQKVEMSLVIKILKEMTI